MKNKSNTKGFTLIELVVVLALISIFMTAMAIMIKPVSDLTKTALDYDSQKTITNEANTYVCQSVRLAKYATIYTNCKALPATAINDFKTFSGATDTNIKIVAIINDFSGANSSNTSGVIPCTYNGSATPNDFGRILVTSSVSSITNKANFYVAMGKWFYGNKKYTYTYSFDETTGIMTIKSVVYDNGTEGVISEMTSRFLNYTGSTKIPAPIVGTGSNAGTNTYIVYNNK